MMEKRGNPTLFRPDFITAINLREIKARPSLPAFVLLIHISVRLVGRFDSNPDTIRAGVANVEPGDTFDL